MASIRALRKRRFGTLVLGRRHGQRTRKDGTQRATVHIARVHGDARVRRAEVEAHVPEPVGRVARAVDAPAGNYYFANNSTSYRVADDDERFLMARFIGQGARIELVFVQSFFEGLRERSPN